MFTSLVQGLHEMHRAVHLNSGTRKLPRHVGMNCPLGAGEGSLWLLRSPMPCSPTGSFDPLKRCTCWIWVWHCADGRPVLHVLWKVPSRGLGRILSQHGSSWHPPLRGTHVPPPGAGGETVLLGSSDMPPPSYWFISNQLSNSVMTGSTMFLYRNS